MKLYILLGHPATDSFNKEIAEACIEAARHKGHEVRVQRLSEMHFDPILRGKIMYEQLEPCLQEAQENILWCERWVIIYPVWWGSLPALLKGFIDRTLVPGFGYRYHANDPLWDKLLKGRSAHLITTSDAPWWWLWWQYRDSDVNTLRKATLEFCGISPVRVTRIDRVRFLTAEQRQRKIVDVAAAI